MPNGVPVATVALNAAKNAGLLSAEILASHDSDLLDKMLAYKEGLAESVAKKYNKLEAEGYEDYVR